MGNIFKRPSRREDAIARAEYEQVTGRKMPAQKPAAKPAPMKSTPVPSVPARSKMGPYKNNKRK